MLAARSWAVALSACHATRVQLALALLLLVSSETEPKIPSWSSNVVLDMYMDVEHNEAGYQNRSANVFWFLSPTGTTPFMEDAETCQHCRCLRKAPPSEEDRYVILVVDGHALDASQLSLAECDPSTGNMLTGRFHVLLSPGDDEVYVSLVDASLRSLGVVSSRFSWTNPGREPQRLSSACDTDQATLEAAGDSGQTFSVLPSSPHGAPCLFWTSNLNNTVSIDMPSLLIALGHSVLNSRVKGLNAPYPEMICRMLQPQWPLPWVLFKLFNRYACLSELQATELFKYYKADQDMVETGVFLCFFPASLCKLFMQFNWTIIFVAAHPFMLCSCSSRSAQRLFQCLSMLLAVPHPGDSSHLVLATSTSIYVISVLPKTSFAYTLGRTKYCLNMQQNPCRSPADVVAGVATMCLAAQASPNLY